MFELKAEWIKEIVSSRNTNWNYDYKEYIFNESYTDAFSIRIPQGAIGIKAMLYSNDSGIKEEYQKVILLNEEIRETIFDMDKVYEQILLYEIEKLRKENEMLKLLNCNQRTKLDSILAILQ